MTVPLSHSGGSTRTLYRPGRRFYTRTSSLREAARRRVEHALPVLRAIDLYDALPYQIRFTCVVRPNWPG